VPPSGFCSRRFCSSTETRQWSPRSCSKGWSRSGSKRSQVSAQNSQPVSPFSWITVTCFQNPQMKWWIAELTSSAFSHQVLPATFFSQKLNALGKVKLTSLPLASKIYSVQPPLGNHQGKTEACCRFLSWLWLGIQFCHFFFRETEKIRIL
jgi:hypothetical protein